MSDEQISDEQIREIEIALRIKSLRQRHGLEQAAFAELIGIRRERLASYEVARVAIPYEIANEIGRVFNVGLHWLARGVRPMFPYISLPVDSLSRKPMFSEKFSKFYDEVLSKPLEKEILKRFPKIRGKSSDPRARVLAEIDHCFKYIGKEEWKRFAAYITEAASDFCMASQQESVPQPPSLQFRGKVKPS